MQFSFRVGVSEQHQVDFSFDQFIGNLEIRVDGQPLVKDFRMLSLKLIYRKRKSSMGRHWDLKFLKCLRGCN